MSAQSLYPTQASIFIFCNPSLLQTHNIFQHSLALCHSRVLEYTCFAHFILIHMRRRRSTYAVVDAFKVLKELALTVSLSCGISLNSLDALLILLELLGAVAVALTLNGSSDLTGFHAMQWCGEERNTSSWCRTGARHPGPARHQNRASCAPAPAYRALRSCAHHSDGQYPFPHCCPSSTPTITCLFPFTSCGPLSPSLLRHHSEKCIGSKHLSSRGQSWLSRVLRGCQEGTEKRCKARVGVRVRGVRRL